MTYKIIRTDGKDDELTAQSFDNYSDAYDLLEELYGDLCCSDADYGEITYYDIVENNSKNINEEKKMGSLPRRKFSGNNECL